MTKIEEIKALRKNLDLTQQELAGLSGVSQSLIARIESGRVDPAFSKVEKIFNALEEAKSKKINMTAEAVMIKNVIAIHPKERITRAASIMKNRNISQLPVVEKDKVIGTISEKEISHSISENPKDLLVWQI